MPTLAKKIRELEEHPCPDKEDWFDLLFNNRDLILAALDDQESYNELLYQVGKKYEGETRHQTALKYIKWAEAEPVTVASKSIDSERKN